MEIMPEILIHVHVKGADGKAKFEILPEGIVQERMMG
jgi:hypothetical protein